MTQQNFCTKLISFLGTGKPIDKEENKYKYDELNYVWQDKTISTEYVANALYEFFAPKEVVILATKEAECAHIEKLKKLIPVSKCERIPKGSNDTELWKQFETIVNELSSVDEGECVIDITHGFRSQPFFASAAIAFVKNIMKKNLSIRVVYGAYEPGNSETHIWELSAFTDLVSWTQSISQFLETGRTSGIAEKANDLGSKLRKNWAVNGRVGEPPKLRELGQAIEDFGDNLETIRTGALLVSDKPSAKQLVDRIEQIADTDIPTPLKAVMEKVRERAALFPQQNHLSTQEGQKTLAAMARMYLEMGRYAEAAATLREAWITRHACPKSDCPGTESFTKEHREAAEKAWQKENPDYARRVAEVRNDIEHAGYKTQPLPAKTIKKQLDQLLELFEQDLSRNL
jgi:CRISPR-associated protein Csx16